MSETNLQLQLLVDKVRYELREAIQGMNENIQGDYWFGRFNLAREVLQIIDIEREYEDIDFH
jgi:hypothetical protein